MKKKLLIALLCISFSSNVWAAVGEISAMLGKAVVERESEKFLIDVGFKLEEKDTIITYANSKARIVFVDQTKINIGENSNFSISKYFYDETAASQAEFKSSHGVFKTVTGYIGKINPKRFKVRTGNSTMGIRGTEFVVETDKTTTTVGVIQGQVYFIDKNNYHMHELEEGKFLSYDSRMPRSKQVSVTDGYVESKKVIKKRSRSVKGSDDGETQADSSDVPNDAERPNVLAMEEFSDEARPTEDKKILVYEDNHLSLSHWINGDLIPYDPTVSGDLTPNEFIDGYIKNNITATYGGLVHGVSKEEIVEGAFKMDFDFAQQKMDGNMYFNSEDGPLWVLDIKNGSVSSNSFSSNDLSDTDASEVKGVSGNLDGNFYGNEAQSVGGSFGVTSTTDGSVEGVFGGTAK